jgi:hypothetical protein
MGERDSHLRIHVETYAGHRADEAPRAFVLGTRRIAVAEELDRWLDPQHRYFKVRGNDGDIYILRYDVPSDAWELTLFSPVGAGRACRPPDHGRQATSIAPHLDADCRCGEGCSPLSLSPWLQRRMNT